MAKGKRQSALLVEIIIAVLFFALSATVILDVFATAYARSAYAQASTEAMIEAQNLSELIYVSTDAEALLLNEGFVKTGDEWLREEQAFDLRVQFTREEAEAGELLTARIAALSGEQTLIELPCVRYIPGEVTR